MSKPAPYADLEISEDPAFTKKGWTFERIGWLLLALLLAAALAGVFGGGPLAKRTIANDDGLRLQYERFGRRASPLELRVRLPKAKPSETSRVRIDRHYLSTCQIEKISPTPIKTVLGGDWLIFVFSHAAEDEALVLFHLEPQEFGFLQGRLGMDDGEPLAFDQFIYP